MRIAETGGMRRPDMGMPAKPYGETRFNDNSGVSREEKLQLLAGKVQPANEEKFSNTYSERAQLLSNTTKSRHSWVA